MRLQRLFLALGAAVAIAACSGHGGGNGLVPNSDSAGTASGTSARAPLAPNTSDSKVHSACGAAVRGQAQCMALVRTDLFYKTAPKYALRKAPAGADLRSMASSGYYGPLDPAHIQQAYNIPSMSGGTNEVVGIVDAYDDPNAEADMAAYRMAFGLPPCTTANKCFRKINQNGSTSPLPSPDPGWAEEIALDLDMVSATCPLCKITLVEANSNSFSDLGTAEQMAAAAGARSIGNSYGGLEYQSADPNYAIPGRVIIASSGDNSFYAGPQAPCVYASVVCVGGTSIFPYNNTRGWLETAWTDTGSGCSIYVPAPAWQTLFGVKCPNGTRAESDVSAVADPYTGVLVYMSYPAPPGFYVFGGTSASAQIINGIYGVAMNGQNQSGAAKLWVAGFTHPTWLNDVTIGNNGQPGVLNAEGKQCAPVLICYAMPGYDGPTGNGTPNGIQAF